MIGIHKRIDTDSDFSWPHGVEPRHTEPQSDDWNAMREALERIVELAGPSGKTAPHQWGAAFAIASAALRKLKHQGQTK